MGTPIPFVVDTSGGAGSAPEGAIPINLYGAGGGGGGGDGIPNNPTETPTTGNARVFQSGTVTLETLGAPITLTTPGNVNVSSSQTTIANSDNTVSLVVGSDYVALATGGGAQSIDLTATEGARYFPAPEATLSDDTILTQDVMRGISAFNGTSTQVLSHNEGLFEWANPSGGGGATNEIKNSDGSVSAKAQEDEIFLAQVTTANGEGILRILDVGGELSCLLTDENGNPLSSAWSPSGVVVQHELVTGLSAKANASAVVPNTRTVAGKALNADVTLAKGDVGLGNVDNTSDASKPVSTATQSELNKKFDKTLVVATVPETSDPNQREFKVGSRNVSYLNEWGALRGRNPYSTWADALGRGFVEQGDNTNGNVFELEDRRTGAPTDGTKVMWGRRWADGALIRNGLVMSDTIVLASGAPVPSNLPANSIIIRPTV